MKIIKYFWFSLSIRKHANKLSVATYTLDFFCFTALSYCMVNEKIYLSTIIFADINISKQILDITVAIICLLILRQPFSIIKYDDMLLGRSVGFKLIDFKLLFIIRMAPFFIVNFVVALHMPTKRLFLICFIATWVTTFITGNKKINRNAILKEFFKLNPIKKKNWKSKNKMISFTYAEISDNVGFVWGCIFYIIVLGVAFLLGLYNINSIFDIIILNYLNYALITDLLYKKLKKNMLYMSIGLTRKMYCLYCGLLSCFIITTIFGGLFLGSIASAHIRELQFTIIIIDILVINIYLWGLAALIAMVYPINRSIIITFPYLLIMPIPLIPQILIFKRYKKITKDSFA